MKNITLKFICILICLGFAQDAHTQRLKDFIKKTTQEIEDGVTDAVAKAVADKIVEKAVSSFGGTLDTLLDNAFKLDSASRVERGDTINYFDFINGLNESDKVPEQYTFQLGFETSNTDDKGNVTESIQYYNKDGDYFGILSEGTLMVMDAKNEILTTFNMEEKKGFAMGKTMMRSAGALVGTKMFLDYEIEKTNETKTILGYKCYKYIGSSSGYNFETFIAPDFPINIHDAYGDIVSMYFNEQVAESYKELKGMSLESKTMIDGDTYYSVVTKVLDSGISISKSDYDFSLE